MLKNAVFLVCAVGLVGSNTMEPFIVGGKPTSIQRFGHSAFLIVEINQQGIVCGASVLNQNVVLSAAHCFEGFNRLSKVTIRAGNSNKMKGSLRYAARLAMHSEYDKDTIENDIALVYFRRPLVFSSYIKRVIIMKRPPASRVGYVAGWGVINEILNSDTNMLHKMRQILWSREECKKVLRGIPLGILCGGVRYGDEYASDGDSGSALVVNDTIQVGLVSFKRPDVSKSIIAYTDVSYFYNWISATARKLYCP